MPRYVDADILMKDFACFVRSANNSDFAKEPNWNDAVSIVENAPDADVVERKIGKWVHLGGDEWCCSVCGHVTFTEGSWEHPLERGNFYCEHCGAKLGDKDDE